MKKLFLSATAIATVMSASAFAADLPSIKSAPAAPVPLWTGFYAGMNAGYAFGITDGASNYGWANPYAFSGYFDRAVSANSAASYALASSSPGRGIYQGGFIGGGQVGYNYQYGQKIVLGFEADMQGAGIRGTGNANGFGPFTNSTNPANGFINNNIVQAGIDWLGTARGRVGYLITPTLQLYGTGGLAYGSAFLNTRANSAYGGDNGDPAAVSSSWNIVGTDTSHASKSQLLVGYVVGAGGEWMFMPNWSIKAEALYYNLGTQKVSNYIYSYGASYPNVGLPTFAGGSTTQARYDGVIGRAGVNYHFNWNAPTEAATTIAVGLPTHKSASPVASTPIWNGYYAGLNAGYAFGITGGASNYGWANPSPDVSVRGGIDLALAGSAPGQGINQGGFVGGGQVGYNYQLGSKIILGFEADMQGAGIRGTGNANGVGPWPNGTGGRYNYNLIQAGIDWLGTARGRIGYLITPSFQIYGTGGLAYGGAFLNTFTNNSNFRGQLAGGSSFDFQGLTTSYASANQLLVGYSAGGGGEWMFSNNWSVKAEAIYYNLGTQSVSNTYYGSIINPSSYALLAGSTTRARYDGVIGRAGINYHFDFGRAAPVVAKF
jgi:outer membrane immunogenic protein